MNLVSFVVELFFHLDDFLAAFINQYGTFVYLLVFIILFCETGLFLPLPGDSLIFACGAFSAAGLMSFPLVLALCFFAALSGDYVNYHIGKKVGRRLYDNPKGRLVKRESIDRAQSFYDRHGGKAIVLSRFIPLVRQCTPFVAGIGRMGLRRFMSFNLIGVTAWVGLSGLLGFFFGNIPVVKDNFSTVILAIIFVSLLPAVIAFVRAKVKERAGS